MRVAQVVQANLRHPGASGDALERLGDGVGVDHLAVPVGEHPRGRFDADGPVLSRLPHPPGSQHRDGSRIEVDPPSGVDGLARVSCRS